MWRDGLRVLPSDIRGFMQRGQVAESLKPMVAHATTVLGAYSEELGGDEHLTAGQRVQLAGLFQSIVVGNALFSRYLRA